MNKSCIVIIITHTFHRNPINHALSCEQPKVAEGRNIGNITMRGERGLPTCGNNVILVDETQTYHRAHKDLCRNDHNEGQ